MRPLFFLALLVVGPLAGCSDEGAYASAHPGGGYGATPGGHQDVAYARMQVGSGAVPSADSFSVEGLLSEHDIPIDGAPCTDLLCARPSVAVAPSLETGADEHWMVLGMSSGIVDFHRPPIDLALVLDASGAMSVDMAQVIESASQIVMGLRPDDRISVVVFRDGADVMQHMTLRGDDPSALIRQLHGIVPQGGAAFRAGLEAGYAEVRAVGDDPTRLRRVITFSCGYEPDELTALTATIEAGGLERIGLTFVGVLLGYDYTLAGLLSHDRGGNDFYTATLDDIGRVFATDLDFTITPLAYDLHLDLALAAGWRIADVYGVSADASGATSPNIDVSTAFISRRRGAVVVRLARDPSATDHVGTSTLSYVPESALGWDAPYDVSVDITEPTVAGLGARKAVALVNEALRLRAASTAWFAHDEAGARRITDALLTYLRAEADATGDADLRQEVTFVESYRALLGA